MLQMPVLVRHHARNSLLLQVGMIVWVRWITFYLTWATRSLQRRPYTAFRCLPNGRKSRLSVRLCSRRCAPRAQPGSCPALQGGKFDCPAPGLPHCLLNCACLCVIRLGSRNS